MEESKALPVMEEANRILEDFSLSQFVAYTLVFLVEIVLCFWVAARL
ncbi:MAG: hypothetical protein GX443_18630 [Deltaproteobacteria bacterium]|nr:hypothetical protein [Deltaproteobacteria bacterium]